MDIRRDGRTDRRTDVAYDNNRYFFEKKKKKILKRGERNNPVGTTNAIHESLKLLLLPTYIHVQYTYITVSLY